MFHIWVKKVRTETWLNQVCLHCVLGGTHCDLCWHVLYPMCLVFHMPSFFIVTLFPDLPVALSFPHFYMADPHYLEQVEGLQPNGSLHRFQLTLEPVSIVSHSGASTRQTWVFGILSVNISLPFAPGFGLSACMAWSYCINMTSTVIMFALL